MAARRIRRRHESRQRREGEGRNGRPGKNVDSTGNEAVRRPCRGRAALESAGVRPRRHRPRPGGAGHVGRVGGFRRAARSCGRLPPGSAPAVREVQLRVRAVRSLRSRLHPHADRFRSRIGGRHREVQSVHGRGELARRLVRRIAVRRAWGRAVEGTVPVKDVRTGTGRGVPRIQAHLGPRRPDESRQDRRAVPHRSESAARRRLPSATADDAVPLSGGSPQLRVQHDPLCRRRRLPPPRRRDDVSELSRHARRGALDARPRAPALRDAAGQSPRWRMEGCLCKERAGFVPCLQRMQEGMSGQRRHGDIQGGVPVALLRGTPAAANGVCDGAHPSMGTAGVARAADREHADADAGSGPRGKGGCRHLTAPHDSAVGRPIVCRLVPIARAHDGGQPWRSARADLARYVQ